VTPLLETWLKILAFLLLFVLREDFVWIFVALGFGIGVRHTDIDNTIRPAGPKATHKDISTVVVNE
jgi:hypothetical protein